VPVRAVGNGKTLVGHLAGVSVILAVVVGGSVLFVPHIRQPLEKQQGKDVLLVVARIHQPAQNSGRAPQVGVEVLLGEPHDPSPGPSPERGGEIGCVWAELLPLPIWEGAGGWVTPPPSLGGGWGVSFCPWFNLILVLPFPFGHHW